jgi:ubiquinone/menaquinone biosynthesis C-methylase UbiE
VSSGATVSARRRPPGRSNRFGQVGIAHDTQTYWESVAESRWGAYVTDRERTHLLDALGRLEPGVSLEVGCEGGRWSRLVSERGWQVICTDVDEASLERCRARVPSAECILVRPNDRTLPVGDASVRLVLIYEVAPVMDSDWILADAARVLESGGLLVCSTWNPRSARGAAYRLLARVSTRENNGVRRFQDYYRGPPHGRFRKQLESQGFHVVRERGLCWFPFGRSSDSRLVGPATTLESALGLSRLPTLSPWVLTIAERRSRPAPTARASRARAASTRRGA